MLNMLQKAFSVRNKDSHKIITICDIKIKLCNHRLKSIFDKKIRPLNIKYLSSDTGYTDYLFPKLEEAFDNNIEVKKNPNFFL